MTATRHLLAVSAVAAAAFAAPASAQAVPHPGPGPDVGYEYAVPPPPGAVVYDTRPVIQPLPAPPMAGPAPQWHDDRGPSYRTEHHAYRHAEPLPGYAPPPPPHFDRDAWLADCRARISGVRGRNERASVIVGLLGAITGGIIGNRTNDSNRTAGTLIGAGVGGLAGLAIGAAIDASGRRKRVDECAYELDRYMGGGYRAPEYGYAHAYPGPGYGYPMGYGYPAGYGYNHGYGQWGYTMMPVLVAVPQRQVVREYVTEEYVDVPVRTRTITRTRTIRERAPAPRPDKRIKHTKN